MTFHLSAHLHVLLKVFTPFFLSLCHCGIIYLTMLYPVDLLLLSSITSQVFASISFCSYFMHPLPCMYVCRQKHRKKKKKKKSGNRWEHSLRQCHYFACKPWMSAHYNVRHPSIFGVQLFQTFTNYLITHWAWPRLWWWGINLREIHLLQQSLQVWWSFLHYICNACRLLWAWLYKVRKCV